MVLKCLNHIYRLSTDAMFLTWSPFVWMKINWWQMGKDLVKRVEDNGLNRSAPKWPFLGNTQSWSSAATDRSRSSQGLWYFTGTVKWKDFHWIIWDCSWRRGRCYIWWKTQSGFISSFLSRRRARQSQQTLSYILVLIIIIIINIIIIIMII